MNKAQDIIAKLKKYQEQQRMQAGGMYTNPQPEQPYNGFNLYNFQPETPNPNWMTQGMGNEYMQQQQQNGLLSINPNDTSFNVENADIYSSPEQLNRMNMNQYLNSGNYNEEGQPINSQPTIYNDTINNSLYNPYSGINLESALFSLGQSIGYKGEAKTANFVRGAASAGKVALGGARTLLSGVGNQRQTDRAYQDYIDKLYRTPDAFQSLQEGGVTNAGVMTGAYLPPNPDGGLVEVERGEYVKNSQTGDIQEAIGEKHSDGGVPVNLPNQSKVLSDFTKIGAAKAKLFRKEFDLKVKANDTFATVMDKYNRKIGFDDLIEEEEKTIEQIGIQQENNVEPATQDLNMNFLSDKLQAIQADKAEMQPLKDEAFETIFEAQEGGKKRAPKKEEMQEGGAIEYPQEIIQLSQQYNISPDRIIQLMQEQSTPEMQAGGTYYNPNSYALSAYENQPFGSVDYLAGNVSTPLEANTRIANAANLYPNLLRQSALLGDNNAVNLSPENITNFQKGYNNYTNSTIAAAGINPNLTPEQRQQLIEQARQESFLEGDSAGVRGYDGKLGNFTSSRGGFSLPYLTTEDRAKYKDLKFIGDAVDAQGNIKPEYADLNPETAKLLQSTVKTAGTSALDIGLLDIPQAAPDVVAQTNPNIVNRTINQQSFANLPVDYILPPSGAAQVYKAEATLSRVDPTKVSIEPNLIEAERQRQSTTDSLAFLPDGQRAAAIASILGQTQQATNAAISSAEQFNAQAQNQADIYNAQQGDKQQLLNNQSNLDFERRTFGSQLNSERDLRAYFTQLNANNKQNFADIRDLNLLNQLYPNYQTNGQNVMFNNAPLNFNTNSTLGATRTPKEQAIYAKKYTEEKARLDAKKNSKK